MSSLKTEVARKLLGALTDYGGYLDDNTAWDAGAFNVEGGVIDEVAAAYTGLSLRAGAGQPFYDDMVAIFQQLHIIDNNSNSTKGGGGIPRRPTAPPICDD
jgi:hypothetical protein